MRVSRIFGAALGTGLLFVAFSSGANAWDGYRDRDRDHWRYEHDRREAWRHDAWRHDHPVVVHERPVVVRERPMIVERPVMMAPPPMPMYAAPAPVYNQAPSGLNLNFNIPLN